MSFLVITLSLRNHNYSTWSTVLKNGISSLCIYMYRDSDLLFNALVVFDYGSWERHCPYSYVGNGKMHWVSQKCYQQFCFILIRLIYLSLFLLRNTPVMSWMCLINLYCIFVCNSCCKKECIDNVYFWNYRVLRNKILVVFNLTIYLWIKGQI